MADTERWTPQQYREHIAGKKPLVALAPKPIFEPKIYESSSGEFVINVEPMGAPRVNRNSRWGNKKVEGAIARYDALKAKIKSDCEVMGYKLGGVAKFRFEISMPASWSDKKKRQYAGQMHQQKPDIDNIIKGIFDAFGEDDSHVHTVTASKIWAYTGRIVIIR